MYELKEYLKSINTTKQNLMDSEDKVWEKKYPSFIINKCLASSIFLNHSGLSGRLLKNGGFFT